MEKETQEKRSHAVNAVLVGDNVKRFEDWNFIVGPQLNKFGLAGRLLNIDETKVPLKQGHEYTREEIQELENASWKLNFKEKLRRSNYPVEVVWKSNFEEALRNAKNEDDLDDLGRYLNYAIDNNLNIFPTEYQLRAARKMTEIYNKAGESKVA